MNGDYRHVAVISQFFSMTGLEQTTQERVSFRNGNDHIDIFILRKLAYRVEEIILADEIKFGLVITEDCFQFYTLCLILVGNIYIVLAVYVYDMQAGPEQVQHRFYGHCRHGCFHIFEIAGKKYILDGMVLRIGWY